MPRRERQKIGEIYRERTVKTFGDKVKEFLANAAGCAVILIVIFLIAT